MDNSHNQYLLKFIMMGKRKGLSVVANRFLNGWSIRLPNGSVYSAIDNNDMINYVKGY